MAKRQWFGEKGLKYYEHPEITIPDPEDRRKRRPMRNYYLQFKWQGKVHNEAIGWEDVYPLAEVRRIAAQLEKNRKEKIPPFTWSDQKELNNKQYLEQKAEEDRQKVNTYDTFFRDVYLAAKRRKMLEGALKEKHYLYLQTLHDLHINPVIGNRTWDQITKDDFDFILENMRQPVTVTRRVRDYEAEDAYESDENRDRRRKLFYRDVTETKPRLSMKTVQSMRAMAAEVWKSAAAAGLAKMAFPGAHIARGTLNNSRVRYFTPEEVETILDDLKRRSLEVYHYTVIAAFSGLRVSSIFNLTWGDLESQVAKDTKNKTNVPITIFRVVQRLQDVISERRAMRPDAKRNDYIFPRHDGQKRGQMTKTYKRCLEDLRINANVTDTREIACFHTLRHTYASWLVQRGLSLEKVADLLGHKTLQMTNRYKHLSEKHYHEAAEVLNSL